MSSVPVEALLWGEWQIRDVRWRYIADEAQSTTLRIYAVPETIDYMSHVIEPMIFGWRDGEFQNWRVFRVPHSRIPDIANDVRGLVAQGYQSAEVSRIGPIGTERDCEALIAELRQEAPSLPAASMATPLPPDDWDRVWQTISALGQVDLCRGEVEGLSQILTRKRLAHMVGVSEPDLVAFGNSEGYLGTDAEIRLHYIAGLVAMLKATYNELAVRRWFERRRDRLGGQSPAEVLSGGWAPGDEDAARVIALAKASLL